MHDAVPGPVASSVSGLQPKRVTTTGLTDPALSATISKLQATEIIQVMCGVLDKTEK